LDIIKHINKLRNEIKLLRGDVEVVDKYIYREFHPETVKMKTNLHNFVMEQKTENFKLTKEIAIVDKEKSEIQHEIYILLHRINKVEKDVGVRSKAFTYFFDQSLLENQIANRIFIEKEDL
jgi:hypothetical protein